MRFKRENCSCVFLTFWKSRIHSVILLSFLSCLNEIPARPQLRKNALSKDILTAWALLTVKNTFFLVFCVVEEIYLVIVHTIQNIYN